MKVVFWGTYDTGKPRTRILLEGLAASGVKIIQIHADVWHGVEDKSGLSARRRIHRLFRWLTAYPRLLVRYLRAPPHDAVVIAYLGQIDVLMLWTLARIRRVGDKCGSGAEGGESGAGDLYGSSECIVRAAKSGKIGFR